MTKKDKPSSVAIATPEQTIANKFIHNFGEQSLWHIIVLFLLPFFIFIKTAGFQFINMDDVAIIQNNYHILGSIKNIGIAFSTDAFLGPHGDFYRPVQTVSFFIDALIGKDNPWIYHVTELVYHLLTVISLYYLLILLNNKKITAFLFSLLFSTLPLLSSAISWIPARGDVLIGLFGILMFLNFIKYISTGKPVYFILHSLLFLVASFTKETTMLFPLLFLFYYFLIAKQKSDIKKLLPFALLWLSVIIFFLILRSKVVIGNPPNFIFGLQPFILNLPTIPIVIAKFFVPVNLSTLPLFESIFTLAGSVILILILFVLYNSAAKKEWLPVMGILWFLVFIAPPMLFKIYYSKYLVEYYEHRAYLPVIGLIIFLAYLFNQKISASKSGNIIWLPLILIALYTPVASYHSDHFKNSIDFFGRGKNHVK